MVKYIELRVEWAGAQVIYTKVHLLSPLSQLYAIEISALAPQTYHLQRLKMKISNLQPEKYNRLFVFGCSMTKYIWPTWADIIAQDISTYVNWGRPGAGNHYIFNAVMECDAKYSFTKDDLVIIMWSSIEREDRYKTNDWIIAAGDAKAEVYGNKWISKFDCTRGNLIRDLALIKAVQTFLDAKSCDWANLSMYALCTFDEEYIVLQGEVDEDQVIDRYNAQHRNLCDGIVTFDPYIKDADVLKVYADVYKNLEYSIEDQIFDGKLGRGTRPNNNDFHPSPLEHLKYLDLIWPRNTLSNRARQYAADWDVQVWDGTFKFSPQPTIRL